MGGHSSENRENEQLICVTHHAIDTLTSTAWTLVDGVKYFSIVDSLSMDHDALWVSACSRTTRKILACVHQRIGY